jgi:antiviral helicase SKI2
LDGDRTDYLQTIAPGFTSGLKPTSHVDSEITLVHTDEENALSAPVVVGENPAGLLSQYLSATQQSIAQEFSNLRGKGTGNNSFEDFDENETNRFFSVEHQKREKQRLERLQQRKQNIIQLQDVFGVELSQLEDDDDDEETHAEPEPVDTNENVAPDSIDALFTKTGDDLLPENSAFTNFLLKKKQEHLAKGGIPKEKKRKEWAIMNNMDVSNFKEMVPEMAMEFPFDLDTFQKEAVYHLENNESVFVSAHTSAGKTVVAEYAIALGQKHLTRVIYTSPIKTLSNQKFREFKKTFGDVGILTGDVQINPTATCLIMTTEILRSMLYKGADIIRDIEWVIFDEVHYINDPERGVVWEEVIIMLPEHINLILLSATIPNTYEFADWIGRTKKKNIYVVGTLKRPVPLEHNLYYGGNLYKIVDHTSTFLSTGYRSALLAQKEKDRFSKNKGGGPRRSDKQDWVNIIALLQKKKLLPVVVFSFSRAKCEEIAYGLSKTDLTTSSEKSEVHVFVEQAISRLKGEDRELPQVIRIKELLKRGIGVHHSGLLPIVKEIVEILFSRGLLKVLFATETFAMGVNMPARTVVFNSLRKHDGRQFRELLSGEYIQMSGRAGRRGLDTVGIVLINCETMNEIPEEPVLQKMILGKATMLESQFRLTYNMMLNLFRLEDFRVEDMIKRSFSEASNQKLLPNEKVLEKSQEKLFELKKKEDDCLYGEPAIDQYYQWAKELEQCTINIQVQIFSQMSMKQITSTLLVPGRVVAVSTGDGKTMGVIVKALGSTAANTVDEENLDMGSVKLASNHFLVLVLRLNMQAQTIPPSASGLPEFSPILFPQGEDQRMSYLMEVSMDKLFAVFKAKLNVNIVRPPNANEETNPMRAAANQLINLWETNAQEGPELIDPKTDLKLNITLDLAENIGRRQQLLKLMRSSKCLKCPKLDVQFEQVREQDRIKQGLKRIKHALSDQNLALMPEFENRTRVLQTLKYIDRDKTVQVKGRVACELNSCEELVVTEMIFENVFTSLTPEECVAVLSCLICQDKTEAGYELTDKLAKAKENLVQLTMSLGQLQMEHGLDTSPTEYVREVLNFGLMEVAYQWALGMPFAEICKLTEILEGSIVRSITQIDQACREVRNAARVIGDAELYHKMEEASAKIKRDIVFAASKFNFHPLTILGLYVL